MESILFYTIFRNRFYTISNKHVMLMWRCLSSLDINLHGPISFVLQATFEIKVEEHVLAGRFNKIQEPLVFQINQPNTSKNLDQNLILGVKLQ